ncbi:phage regulatory CII family protein [Pseudodesulfovibrio sediminis]|nr:phage regulatory CII family protein [Pseudodesulfovibrio sediminis]
MDTQGLADLDAIDAFKLAIEQSPKDLQTIAKEMEWSGSYVRRVFSTENFFPSIIYLPRFCHVVGNSLVLQWLQAKVMTYGIPKVDRDVNCENLAFRIANIFGEVGDLGRKGQEAVADGVLDQGEVRTLINETKDILTEGYELIADLRILERDLAAEGKGASA